MASSKCLLLPSLPFELIEEILYKIPAESLIRFKSTCKKWYNLITEKRFMYNHLDHYSPERFIRTYDQQIIDPVTEILSDALIPDEFRDLFDFSTETFKEICVCPYTLVTRLGCFDGDRLSLLLQGEESQGIEVWMTNKLSDKVVSFSQYFNVTTPDLPALHLQYCMACPGYSIGKRRNIRVWCEGSVDVDDKSYVIITFYEIDEGGVIKQIETASYGQFEYDDPFICCYVYVPSLIPIQ
ncbi:unnamed protein product [Arabidopsis thaliana]|uniref:(thale cress) hypothetical protein n=1 Tax=Arabidopsis thaliana TaxID=3702 RepID=A0A7G2EGV0_ARATH|nr:unnamed protein product [Arabidopsis thaliana]